MITGGVLLVIALAAWAVLLVQPEAPMAGSGLAGLLLFLVAWGVMMTAMMLPSAAPMIAMYSVMRRSENHAPAGIPTAAFALVYLALWVAFGIPVYFVSVIAGSLPALAEVLPYALAVVLIAAGPWSGEVGRLAGVDIPVVPRRRDVFALDDVPLGTLPDTPYILDPHAGVDKCRYTRSEQNRVDVEADLVDDARLKERTGQVPSAHHDHVLARLLLQRSDKCARVL